MRRRLVGQVVDARVLDGVVRPVVAALAALPQRADDLDGLLEHLQAHVGLGPAVAEDVLVERLAAAHAEVEAPVEQHGARGGGLGDDRRVDAHRRAGDARRDRQRRGLRERADDRPHEGAVALLVVPRVVVVGDPQRVEAGRLGAAGLVDEVAGRELLGRKEVADLHGRRRTRDPPGGTRLMHRRLGSAPSGYGTQTTTRPRRSPCSPSCSSSSCSCCSSAADGATAAAGAGSERGRVRLGPAVHGRRRGGAVPGRSADRGADQRLDGRPGAGRAGPGDGGARAACLPARAHHRGLRQRERGDRRARRAAASRRRHRRRAARLRHPSLCRRGRLRDHRQGALRAHPLPARRRGGHAGRRPAHPRGDARRRDGDPRLQRAAPPSAAAAGAGRQLALPPRSRHGPGLGARGDAARVAALGRAARHARLRGLLRHGRPAGARGGRAGLHVVLVEAAPAPAPRDRRDPRARRAGLARGHRRAGRPHALPGPPRRRVRTRPRSSARGARGGHVPRRPLRRRRRAAGPRRPPAPRVGAARGRARRGGRSCRRAAVRGRARRAAGAAAARRRGRAPARGARDRRHGSAPARADGGHRGGHRARSESARSKGPLHGKTPAG